MNKKIIVEIKEDVKEWELGSVLGKIRAIREVELAEFHECQCKETCGDNHVDYGDHDGSVNKTIKWITTKT